MGNIATILVPKVYEVFFTLGSRVVIATGLLVLVLILSFCSLFGVPLMRATNPAVVSSSSDEPATVEDLVDTLWVLADENEWSILELQEKINVLQTIANIEAMEFVIVPCRNQTDLHVAVQLAAEQDISRYNPALDVPEDGPLGWAFAIQLAKHFVKPEGSYIAFVNGDAVGVASGRAEKDEPRYGYFHYLYVKPQYRGMGIGTSLLQAVERYFQREKCRREKISLSPCEETALPFLEKRGYYQSYIAMKKDLPR